MKTVCRWPVLAFSGMGLALVLLTGCQTWVPAVGMTLPSGRYLQHPPQYFPHSPPFPLSRELASQERIAAQANASTAVRPVLPEPVVPPAPAVPPGGPAAAPAPAPAPAPPP
jgi:hypothetical protein